MRNNPKKIALSLSIALLAGLSAHAESLKGTRPNIVIVMPDDLSYGSIPTYGGKKPSPHIDKLAQIGMRFEDFHVSPTCAPTRAALLTGRHEAYAGVTHTIMLRDRMNPDQRLLTHMLKDAGYTTGIFGKWHLGDDAEYRPDSRGFDETYIHGAGGIAQNYSHSADFPNNDYNNPVLYHNGKVIETKGYCTDLFFDQAIRWIKAQQNDGKPFFCFITPNVNHSPKIPPILPDGSLGDIMENLDDNVGKMTQFLGDAGLLENTLYIYMTDNGMKQSGTKKLNGGKASAYEGGTRVPCFMYWKGKVEGGECNQLVGHIDFYATFAELVGSKDAVPGGKAWDGRSFLTLLENPEAEWDNRYWVSHKTRWNDKAKGKYAMAAIRDERFKLVYPKPNKPELYDLQADLSEKKNVIDQYPEVAEHLKAQFDAWWNDAEPYMINDDLPNVPKEHKPYHELYREAFGDEKFEAAMTAMTWEGGKGSGDKKAKSKKSKGKEKRKNKRN